MNNKGFFSFRIVAVLMLLLPAIVFGHHGEKNFVPANDFNTRSKTPVIQQFSATQADCQIIRSGFLFYQIAGLVMQIEIFAVYEDGHRRRCYGKMSEMYWNGLSESDIPDPGMDGDIVGYLITATGPNGQSAERTLTFRTPTITVFEPAGHFVNQTVLEPGGKDSRVRYQLAGRFSHIKRVEIFSGIKPGAIINIQGAGAPFSGQVHVGSDSLWWDAAMNDEWAKLKSEFEIQAFGNDGCQEKIFHWRVKVLAER